MRVRVCVCFAGGESSLAPCPTLYFVTFPQRDKALPHRRAGTHLDEGDFERPQPALAVVPGIVVEERD